MLRYLETLLANKARFALIFVVVPALLLAGSVLLFPTYRGAASLWVETPSYFGTGFVPAGWSQYLSPAQNETDSLTQLVKTASFATLLADHLDADGYIRDQGDRDQYLRLAGGQLTIAAVGSHLVQLAVTCDRPIECLALLKETIAVVKFQQAELQKAQAQEGLGFLQASLDQAQARLRTSQDALQKWLGEHPGVSPTATPAPAELERLQADFRDKSAQVSQIQGNLGQAQYYASASATLLDTGPKVIDQPRITKGGLYGDGSSLKRGLMASAAVIAVGAAHLWFLVWVDKTTRDGGELERRFKVHVVSTIPLLGIVERL